MSMVSKNPFDILGDDGDSPSPAPAAPKAAPAPAAAPARAVPGSQAPRGTNNRGGRGGNRGAPRAPRGDRNENRGPAPTDGSPEEIITAGGFDGERLPPSRKAHHGQDAHTKGPRGSRPARGGDRTQGGSKTPAQGGERRQFERRSGAYEDSQKKVEAGWGADEGKAELSAEVEGEKDAQDEEAAPGTPAEAADAPAAEATPVAPEEPEEITKSYEEYLAEKNAAALADGLGKKEGRKVEVESVEGKAFRREAMDEFFNGKQEKEAATKTKAPKKEKITIPFEGRFAPPARAPRPEGERGERGADRGERGGRGRGGPRGGRGASGGAARGRGAPRGGRGFGGPAPVDASDEKAFPALGA